MLNSCIRRRYKQINTYIHFGSIEKFENGTVKLNCKSNMLNTDSVE